MRKIIVTLVSGRQFERDVDDWHTLSGALETAMARGTHVALPEDERHRRTTVLNGRFIESFEVLP